MGQIAKKIPISTWDNLKCVSLPARMGSMDVNEKYTRAAATPESRNLGTTINFAMLISLFFA
jgi:hypothetical protein